MLDEAVQFFQRFIQADHATAMATYGERDSQVYASRYEELQRFLKGVTTMDSRVRDIDDVGLDMLGGEDWFESGKQVLQKLRPATLFQVKHYQHPRLGDLYRAYVSHPREYVLKAYGFSFYAARVDGDLRIISVYGTCDECSMTGQVQGKPCRECGGTGWRFLEGERLGDLGKLVEVRKFQAPTLPEQRQEYEAE